MALGSAPLAAAPPPSAQDDYRAAEDEKQTNNNPHPPKKPKLTSFPHPKEAPCWTGQDGTGQDSKATGWGEG